MPKVGEVMNVNVLKIDGEKTVDEAVGIMGEKHVGSLIVTLEGTPQGIFTERDLITKILSKGVDMRNVKVKDFMSKPIVTVKPELDVREAARIMAQLHVRRLPAVDEKGRLVGIFTSSDLAMALAKSPLKF